MSPLIFAHFNESYRSLPPSYSQKKIYYAIKGSVKSIFTDRCEVYTSDSQGKPSERGGNGQIISNVEVCTGIYLSNREGVTLRDTLSQVPPSSEETPEVFPCTTSCTVDLHRWVLCAIRRAALTRRMSFSAMAMIPCKVVVTC